MPRALTEQEKCRQCQILLEKGKVVVMANGCKKVSIDDVTKAAGMAKGTFYHHFDSKEKYLLELVKVIHNQLFADAEKLITSEFAEKEYLKANARLFIQKLFNIPELSFFIKYERDIVELLYTLMPEEEISLFKEMEEGMFESVLELIGADTEKVKPGIVHNFIHTMYLIKSSDLMMAEYLSETMDLITDSLAAYIFGGAE